jgi:hypothetical protein
MGIGWGAAALVGGMAAMVLLGLVLVTADGRTGRIWPRVAGVVAGGLVVAGCAWLTVAPVRAETDDGPMVCVADRDEAPLDASCRTAVTQRRVVVFTGLGIVVLAGGWLLLRPSRPPADEGPDAPGTEGDAPRDDPERDDPERDDAQAGAPTAGARASGDATAGDTPVGRGAERKGGARRAAPPARRRGRGGAGRSIEAESGPGRE